MNGGGGGEWDSSGKRIVASDCRASASKTGKCFVATMCQHAISMQWGCNEQPHLGERQRVQLAVQKGHLRQLEWRDGGPGLVALGRAHQPLTHGATHAVIVPQAPLWPGGTGGMCNHVVESCSQNDAKGTAIALVHTSQKCDSPPPTPPWSSPAACNSLAGVQC